MFPFFSNEKNIRQIFVISIALKAINGAFEIVLGIAALFMENIISFVQTLTENELIEDPHSIVANHIQNALHSVTIQTEHFISLYLLSHGIIKLVLAVGLLRNKLWAYPSAIGVFTLFIIYQTYRYTIAPSFFLIVLTVFDLVVISLTWHEYTLLKKRSTTNELTQSN